MARGVCSRSYFLLCSNIGSLILDLELASSYQRKMLSRTTNKCENVFVYSKIFLLFWGDFLYIHILVCACKNTFLGLKLVKLCFFQTLIAWNWLDHQFLAADLARFPHNKTKIGILSILWIWIVSFRFWSTTSANHFMLPLGSIGSCDMKW